MNSDSTGRKEISRRTALRRGAVVSMFFGLGMATATSTAAAMSKGELVEAIASQPGLSKADSKKALEGFINATTRALKEDGRAAWASFGSFSISKRSARTGRNRQPETGTEAPPENVVQFKCGDELAAALDLLPGEGDERRFKRRETQRQNGTGGPRAESLIDADRLARDADLPRKTAALFLDAFVIATTKTLKNEDRLSLIGFGSFSISKRSARTGRNPQTGRETQTTGKRDVKFKAGAELSKSVN